VIEAAASNDSDFSVHFETRWPFQISFLNAVDLGASEFALALNLHDTMRTPEYRAYQDEGRLETEAGRDSLYGVGMQTSTIFPERTILAKDLAQEISFYEYRLAVLCGWPDSERRAALIDATAARLRDLRSMWSDAADTSFPVACASPALGNDQRDVVMLF
jgi:hypothetical protein